MPLYPPPLVPPAIVTTVGNEYVAALTQTLGANVVYCNAWETQAVTTVLGGKWYMGGTVTGKTNIAIYTIAGNLVANSDSGQLTNVASSQNSFTYGTPITLAPGIYIAALAPSNATDTYLARAATAHQSSHIRSAANALAAGVMPATLGALSSVGLIPDFSLTIQGGI